MKVYMMIILVQSMLQSPFKIDKDKVDSAVTL